MANRVAAINDLLKGKGVMGFFVKGFAWREELLLYGLAVLIGLLTALAAVGFNFL